MKKNLVIPKHIAFILDGNGRWAQKRGLQRLSGHEEGARAIERLLSCAKKFKIKVVSVFAFSTENWKRSKKEVDGIFQILKNLLVEKEKLFCENNFKLNVMGDVSRLDENLQKLIENLAKKTKNNSGTIFNIGLNYGGQAEILRATNLAIKSGLKEIDKKKFESFLYTKELPPPDFIVRTSGEQRLSNFMLWQAAYSELYFPKFFWPSFNEKKFIACLKEFSKRNRKFGNV